MSDALLMLVHRIPYPPNKGDKIRSFHMFQHLCEHYQVHLGTFIDDPKDWAHVKTVQEMCNGGESLFCPLGDWTKRIRAGVGILSGQAYTTAVYRDRTMARWVEKMRQKHQIKRVMIFSSSMAQYVDAPQWQGAGIHRVIDFVDVDSQKWVQYGGNSLNPRRIIDWLEGRRLLQLEKKWSQLFDTSLFVSAAEANLFRSLAPEATERIDYVENGVNFHQFDPNLNHADPYQDRSLFPEPVIPLVFTGAMDYFPNIEAVVWFAEKVFPKVRQQLPNALFAIVGSRPAVRVTALAEQPGIHVTGWVDDVRPWVAHARMMVAPLQTGQGIQNKVLEGMAMARPVLATTLAMEGIDRPDALNALVTDDPDRQADLAVEQLETGRWESLGIQGRQWVQQRYDWPALLQKLSDALEAQPRADAS
ncbi:MAG: TIGR03087 family PEP-CTERM/XrtA system glycosyltransferase [Magnetococcales bacterium]|nr:TIGR03087 family PEP-CTERM/XrtA system glycosyltransferase [Magnetococcales bacterium]